MAGFLTLPPEVRLMIYRILIPMQFIELNEDDDLRMTSSNVFRVNRLLFNETQPLLYSQPMNVSLSNSALRFLRGIGQLNRDALHTIIINLKVTDMVHYECLRLPSWWDSSAPIGYPYPRRAVNFFNILTKCPNALLDISTEPEALDGSEAYPAFANVHGYSRAVVTLDDAQDLEQKTCNHDEGQVEVAAKKMLRRFEEGMKGMMSPCSTKCRIHHGVTGSSATRVLHIDVEREKCPACSYAKFLAIYQGSAVSVFKAVKD